MDSQAPNILDLNGLSRKERKQRLFDILKAFPIHVSYYQRLNQIAAHTGLSKSILYQLARRSGWQARLAAELATERGYDEYGRLLEATAPRIKEIGASQIASSVRGLAFTLLTASKQYVDSLTQTLQFYSDKINLKIAESGGLSQLDMAAAKEIGELQNKLIFVAKQLQNYMVPSAIATLLNTIDYVAPLNDETIQTEHFTVAALQTKLLQMGLPSAFDNPEKAVAGYSDSPLPLLSGWVNTDGNSPVCYEGEADETEAKAD